MAEKTVKQKSENVEEIQAALKALRSDVARVRAVPLYVPIISFAPEKYQPRKSITVVIAEADGEYIATFYDANLSCQGANETEAFDNLNEILLTRLQYLEKQPAKRLGPAMQKQLAVLQECVERIP